MRTVFKVQGTFWKNILVPKYNFIIFFLISSSKRIFCNLCNLQKSQTVCLTNMTWTALSGGRIVVFERGWSLFCGSLNVYTYLTHPVHELYNQIVSDLCCNLDLFVCLKMLAEKLIVFCYENCF